MKEGHEIGFRLGIPKYEDTGSEGKLTIPLNPHSLLDKRTLDLESGCSEFKSQSSCLVAVQ